MLKVLLFKHLSVAQTMLYIAALLLALCVVMLGAYTRLQDAGLSCPDWPTCYGHVNVFSAIKQVDMVNAHVPGSLPPSAKTIPEMVHRYAASTLGLLVIDIGVLAIIRKKRRQPLVLPLLMMALIVLQGLLGMWTVRLGLQPIIVTLHLLGGFATFILLVLYGLRCLAWPRVSRSPPRLWLGVMLATLLAVLVQVFLGGWLSANYAANVCHTFPWCDRGWQQQLDFKQAFTLWQHAGKHDFEYGILSYAARVTIHVMHRMNALVVAGLVALLVVSTRRQLMNDLCRRLVWVVAFLLLCQISLGVANVAWHVPIAVGLTHNLVALGLLTSLVMLLYAGLHQSPGGYLEKP